MKRIPCSLLVATLPFGSVLASLIPFVRRYCVARKCGTPMHVELVPLTTYDELAAVRVPHTDRVIEGGVA